MEDEKKQAHGQEDQEDGIIEEEKNENEDNQYENKPVVPVDLDSSAMLLRPAEQVEDNEMILLNNNVANPAGQ